MDYLEVWQGTWGGSCTSIPHSREKNRIIYKIIKHIGLHMFNLFIDIKRYPGVLFPKQLFTYHKVYSF